MDAHFVTACSRPGDLPELPLLEIAVAGRSNCGKSSLINALTGRTKLVKTSSTPGRTRQIVFFSVRLPKAPEFHLVDLPGYGYAKVSKTEKAQWAPLIDHYIEQREQLGALLLLNDIRRPIGKEEKQLVEWAERRELELIVVLTKADKLSKSHRFAAAQKAAKALGLERRPMLMSVGDEDLIVGLRRRVAGVVSSGSVPPVQSDARVARRERDRASTPLRTIGLTGGIGAGKSVVAKMFAELGLPVVDADQVAREVQASEAIIAAMVKAFGSSILDAHGQLDREALGRIVFSDPAQRAILESITHPAIAEASARRFADLARAGAQWVVYEAALLVEVGRHKVMDQLVVVVADDATRIRRVVKRDGLSVSDVQHRIEAQLTQNEKAKLADYIIDNSGSLDDTRDQVRRVWAELAAASSLAEQ